MSSVYNRQAVEYSIGKKVSTVNKILITQALVVILSAAVFFVFGGQHAALSSALGGMAALLPNLLFAYRIHIENGKAANQIVHGFYAAETRKIILTAVLFIVIFQIPGVNFLTLLAGYVAVLSVFWFALILWRD